jgi:hypothetical protein
MVRKGALGKLFGSMLMAKFLNGNDMIVDRLSRRSAILIFGGCLTLGVNASG